jgi:hypothetical protein
MTDMRFEAVADITFDGGDVEPVCSVGGNAFVDRDTWKQGGPEYRILSDGSVFQRGQLIEGASFRLRARPA